MAITSTAPQTKQRQMWKLFVYSGIDAFMFFVRSPSAARTRSCSTMVVVAKTLDLMGQCNTYFWVTFLVRFLVTAITVRIWPLNVVPDTYHPDAKPQPEEEVSGSRLSFAWREAQETVAAAPSLGKNIWINVRDGVLMTMAILPSILSIGLLGLVLATYTPVFDWLGYVFYPFTWALQIPEPMLVAKASAVGIAEMFLPALIVAKSAVVAKFVIGVVSVSGIIFFSALVPCIMATDIPIPLWKLVVIWFQRVVLTLILVTPIAFLLF